MVKNLLTIGSAVIILLGALGVISNYGSRKDYLSGYISNARLISWPNCGSIGSRGDYIKVQCLNDKKYIMKISSGQCENLDLSNRREIQIIISRDGERVFFKEQIDDFYEQMAASALILAGGVICLIKSKRKI